MTSLVFVAHDETDTQRLAQALSASLADGAVVALCGTLGAGKTRLVQAIASAEGVPAGEVVSPTFTLVHEYRGRRPVHHFDAYRLRDEDEFLELGPDEYFDSRGISLVEWADRVWGCLPRQLLRIDIDVTGPHQRRFTLTALGGQYEQSLARVNDRLAAA